MKSQIKRRLFYIRLIPIAFVFLACKKESDRDSSDKFHVSTIAGNGQIAYVDGPALQSSFYEPKGIAFDADGNLFIADPGTSPRIRKLSPEGILSTFAGGNPAGFQNGPNSSARFVGPADIVLDQNENLLISDRLDKRIRKIDISTNTVSSFAGNGISGMVNGSALSSRFSTPHNMVLNETNELLISDPGNYKIRKISTQGIVSTYLGFPTSSHTNYTDGPAGIAEIGFVRGLTFDNNANLYFIDGKGQIRKLSTDGNVSTYFSPEIAGNLGSLSDLIFDGNGNLIGITATCVAYIKPNNGYIIIAGSEEFGFSDGDGDTARFNYIESVVIDKNGDIIVSDSRNQRIRKISKE